MVKDKKNAILIKGLAILSFLLILAACNENSAEISASKEERIAEENIPLAKVEQEDLSEKIPLIKEGIDKDYKENKKKIEKKYGRQWDFCRCVVANDSLDQVVKSGRELNDDFMSRFEEVDSKCKAFLVMNPNNTPEERDLHERKIQECLKANK